MADQSISLHSLELLKTVNLLLQIILILGRYHRLVNKPCCGIKILNMAVFRGFSMLMIIIIDAINNHSQLC